MLYGPLRTSFKLADLCFFRNHWHIYIVNPAKCHFESDWFDRSTIHFHNSSQFMEKEIECVILTHNDIILVI